MEKKIVETPITYERKKKDKMYWLIKDGKMFRQLNAKTIQQAREEAAKIMKEENITELFIFKYTGSSYTVEEEARCLK